MLLYSVFAAVLLSVVFVVPSNGVPITGYTTCASPLLGEGEVTEVDVEPCELTDTGKCKLYRGSSVDITIKFKSNNASDTLTHKVHGVVFNVATPYRQLGSTDACPKVDPPCPIQEHVDITYSSSFNVLINYPAIPVMVRWQLIIGNGKIQVCVLIPVKIERPKTT